MRHKGGSPIVEVMPPLLTPAPGESLVTEWEQVQPSALLASLGVSDGAASGPFLLAIDGRSGGGKSTLAARLASTLAGAVVIAADDFAWNAPMFAWADLVREGLLRPLAAGRDARYRPPAWDEHGRSGEIVASVHAPLVIVEGVGSACRALADSFDAVIWVQSDFAEAERRGLARDITSGVNGDATQSVAFWHAWMADELAFHADERPWERADAIIAGTRVGDRLGGPLYTARGRTHVR